MKFVYPWMLLLIPLLAVAAIIFLTAGALKRRQLTEMIAGKNFRVSGAVKVSLHRRKWKHFLCVAAMLLLVVAAARPYIKSLPLKVDFQGSDILFLVDVSKSMRAADLPPSRMAQAKSSS